MGSEEKLLEVVVQQSSSFVGVGLNGIAATVAGNAESGRAGSCWC